MKTLSKIGLIVSFNLCLSQNIIDSYLFPQNNNMLLKGDSSDGLCKPRDLDIPNDPSRANELWVINENSAVFDPNFGGSTVTFYNAGSDSMTISMHCGTEGSSIFFTLNGSTPSINSIRYENPIKLKETTTVKAISLKTNYLPSHIETVVYKKTTIYY